QREFEYGRQLRMHRPVCDRSAGLVGRRRPAGSFSDKPGLRRVSMLKIREREVSFLRREDGPTAVEYAVMLALIVVVCITAITALGTAANNTFTNVATKVGS